MIDRKIIEWAESNGLMGSLTTQDKRLLKLTEELGELCRAILHGNKKEAAIELGDMYVVMVQIAHNNGIHLSKCASMAYDKISNRSGVIVNGTFVKKIDTPPKK